MSYLLINLNGDFSYPWLNSNYTRFYWRSNRSKFKLSKFIPYALPSGLYKSINGRSHASNSSYLLVCSVNYFRNCHVNHILGPASSCSELQLYIPNGYFIILSSVIFLWRYFFHKSILNPASFPSIFFNHLDYPSIKLLSCLKDKGELVS